MSTPSHVVPDPDGDSGAVVQAALPESRPWYWSVRRELWENRSITIAPAAVAVVVLIPSFLSVVITAFRAQASQTFDAAGRAAAAARPIHVAPAPIMLAAFIVGIFYALDALYGERRDRSILFWKSLPVSDLTTVLAKASIPLVVLPLVAFVLSAATQLGLLLAGSVVMPGAGVSPAELWRDARFFEGIPVMLYGLTVHVLWFAPIYAWLLLISAWARRLPVLWAGLPPLVMVALERLLLGTSHLASLLKYRVTGAMTEAFVEEAQNGHVNRLAHLDPGRFLGAPGLWLGLAAAAGCLALAVRLRRYREPI